MDSSDTHRNPYPYDTTRVTELLKRKRRVRGIKSCFPCRHRKVKCDGNFPCETCVLRGHPEVCCAPSESNGPAQSAVATTNAEVALDQKILSNFNDAEDIISRGSSGANSSVPGSPGRSQANLPGIDLMLNRLEAIEAQISALKTDLQDSRKTLLPRDQDNSQLQAASENFEPGRSLRSPQSLGRNFVEESTGATIFLGNHSDPPAALGCRKVGDTIIPDALLLEQVMPRTYPFTSLWGPGADAAEICGTLPDDSDIIRYASTSISFFKIDLFGSILLTICF